MSTSNSQSSNSQSTGASGSEHHSDSGRHSGSSMGSDVLSDESSSDDFSGTVMTGVAVAPQSVQRKVYYQPPTDLSASEIYPITQHLCRWSKSHSRYIPMAIVPSKKFVLDAQDSVQGFLARLGDLAEGYRPIAGV